MKEKQEQITAAWLVDQGYTLASAARAVNRSRQHVTEVINGNRTSASLVAKILALPKRIYMRRERIAR